MIVCKACATRNADSEEFCTSCGRYLPWSGEHVETEPATQDEPTDVQEPEHLDDPRLGITRRVLIALHIDKSSRNVAGIEPENATEHLDLDPRPLADGLSGQDIPQDLKELPSSDRSSDEGEPTSDELSTYQDGPKPVELRRPGDITSLLPTSPVPVIDVTRMQSDLVAAGVKRTAALRKPDEVVSQQRAISRPGDLKLDESETAAPGDISCSQCGQFNAPTRVYCRRCGIELGAPTGDDAVVTYEPLSWWQRHFHPDVTVVAAGGRPGRWGKIVSGSGSQGRVMRVAGRAGAAVAVVVLILSYLGPTAQPMRGWFSNVWHDINNKVNVTYTSEFATGADASSAASNHPAAMAVDDGYNTWWQSQNYPKKVKLPGVGAHITVAFAQPTTINRIGWLGGVAGTPQAFLSEARPAEIEMTFLPSGNTVVEHLRDTQSFQQFGVTAPNTTAIFCRILKVYPSATGRAVAVTEIEFYQRS